MANCNDQKNPLQHKGTAQNDRLLPGMQKDYVQVDEKTFADWIVFARAYGEYLNYTDPSNAIKGNWALFFSTEFTSILGNIAVQDVDAYRRSIKERFDYLKDDVHKSEPEAAKATMHELFSIILSFAYALDEYLKLIAPKETFRATIENLIQSKLAPALHRLLSYYKPNVLPEGAPIKVLLQPGDLTTLKVIGIPVLSAEEIVITRKLSSAWWVKNAGTFNTWEEYYDSIRAETSVYGNDPDAFMQLFFAANHNLFAGVFDVFLSGYSRMVKVAEKELLTALESRNGHAAHYTLFLTFLKLFRTAQNEINTLTKRHLDFYYKDVLQLKPKAAIPNQAHLLITLNKTVEDYLLYKGTLLKAGKDSEAKDVSYALNHETTFNKAKVADMRAVYIGEADDGPAFDGRMYAAPVINSSDGVGAELETTNKEWHPFANKIYSEGDLFDIRMAKAEIGFAIASHYLYLQEGERKIMIRLDTNNNAALENISLDIYLTTEKEWYKISAEPEIESLNKRLGDTTECVEITFTLSGGEPPISNYNAEVHGGTFGVAVPVIKMILRNAEGLAYGYNALRDLTLIKYEIAVEVGMPSNDFNQQGVKNIQISTDAGVVDPSKPFMPFGAQPKKDAAFVLGSREIFTKKNAKIQLNIEWAGLSEFDPEAIQYTSGAGRYLKSSGDVKFKSIDGGMVVGAFGDNYPSTKFGFLAGGVWGDENSAQKILDSNEQHVKIFSASAQAIPAGAIVPFDNEYSPFGAKAINGFMRFALNDGFGYDDYLKAYSIYLIGLAIGEPPSEPSEPYTPVIQSLYISYSATSDVVNINDSDETKYNGRPATFFHLYPFGEAEQHRNLSNELSHYLFPQFRHKEGGTTVKHQGEFYIGFKDLVGRQSVNVLWQVMDGTADPTISKPNPHIFWSFLAGNKWIDFDKQSVNDQTHGLIQSGIITFIIPAGASLQNTMLPPEMLWIRASVESKVDAVCKLIGVHAQAAIAQFEDHNNARDFLNNALPAGTISKLKIPQAAIKKLEQPYGSFGGRGSESSNAFYVRVSERLRHKARAITIWDYEHLVLEEFPLIHKVKCLNHTKSVDAEYNELLPGHVTIITIPDLRKRNDINPLKPYTSQAMLKAIEAFLKKRTSCHVKLHVVNPDFEEVRLKFKLRLAKGFDDFTIYANKLREEITAFLSPWVNGGEDISFGGKVYKSVLINFIEERPYVDFITDVVMEHKDAYGVVVSPDNDVISASYAKCILVSAPASKHEVEEILAGSNAGVSECEGLKATQQVSSNEK